MDMISLALPERAERHLAPAGALHDPFCVTEYGRTREDTPCYQARNASRVSCLQYVTAGAGVLLCNGRFYTVRTGDVFLLPEGSDQIYYNDVGESFARIWFNFRGQLAHAILDAYGIADQVVFRGADILDSLEEWQTDCRKTTDPVRYQNVCATHFLSIVQRLVAYAEEACAEQPMEKVRTYIDTHITQSLPLADIAREAGLSIEYMIRRFSRTYGVTPHSYILQSKIRMAMVMLCSEELSVGEIAEHLSFSDPHHFSAQFLKYVGMRPSAYRQRYAVSRQTKNK